MSRRGVVFMIPGHGHVNPSLALVRELVARGEAIDYYCTEDFRAAIERTGARFCPLPLGKVVNNNMVDFHLLGVLADLVETTYRVLPPLLEEVKAASYDYLLTDLFALWGRLSGQLLGLPTIMCYPVFATHPEFKDPPHSKLQLLRTPKQTLGHALRVQRYFKRLKKAYHLPFGNPEELLIGAQTTTCLVFTAKELQPQLELFGDNYHFVGPSLDEQVRTPFPDFPYEQLKGGQPVVYISLGSVLNDARFYRQCIQAFEKTPYTVVLNIGPRFAKSDFPASPNIIVCNYAPQLEVLEQASVFITHGGMNSAQESIYHKVPMLVIPQVSDQFLVAQVVKARQLGEWLPKRKVTPKRLRQATEALLDNNTAQKNLAKASQALKQAGGYKRAAEVVLSLEKY